MWALAVMGNHYHGSGISPRIFDGLNMAQGWLISSFKPNNFQVLWTVHDQEDWIFFPLFHEWNQHHSNKIGVGDALPIQGFSMPLPD